MVSKAREAACTNARAAFRCAKAAKLVRIFWISARCKKGGLPKQARLRRRSYGRRETSGANRINTAPSLLPRALRGGLARSAPHGCARARTLPCMSSRKSCHLRGRQIPGSLVSFSSFVARDNIPIVGFQGLFWKIFFRQPQGPSKKRKGGGLRRRPSGPRWGGCPTSSW